MISSTELAQLKKLEQDLNDVDVCENLIDEYKKKKIDLEESCYENINVESPLSTDNAARYDRELKKSKKRKRTTISISVFLITLITLIALLISFLFKFDYLGNEYFSTPEIIQQYTGKFYYDIYLDEAKGYQDHIVTITSCSESGEIEGSFECFKDDTLLGSYSFTGEITGKSTDGYMEARVTKTEWIVEPESENYLPEKFKRIVFSDNFTTLKIVSEYDGKSYRVYSADSEQTAFKTPEIVRTYGGAYKASEWDKERLAVVTISSCDSKGKVKGTFEFEGSREGEYGKYALTGQITQKFSNGVVHITLNSGKWIEELKYYTPLEEMHVIIHDEYTNLSCADYWMFWSADVTMENLKADLKTDVSSQEENEPELLKRRPLTEEETLQRTIMLLSFLVIIGLGFALNFVLKKKLHINDISKREEDRLNELKAKDAMNQKENERKYNELIQKKKQAASSQIEEYDTKISELQNILDKLYADVNANDVLAEKDKKLQVVKYVVDILESRPADSVKEALNMYGQWVKEHDAEIVRKFNEKWNAIERKYKDMQEAEDYVNQKFHNMKLRQEAEKQTDKLKRIEKKLEDLR